MASSKRSPPSVRACLFDMDGLLIDSEDWYTQCTNEVLHEYGKPDIPWSLKAQLQGRPGPESSRLLLAWAQLPGPTEEYHAKIRALQAKYFPRTKPLPGAAALLETLSNTTSPHVHIALATSSHKANFRLKTDHIKPFFAAFKEENRVLGDDERIPSGRGKPAPDIYLLALKTLNDALKREGAEHVEIQPEECLVLEDSVPGVEAGRRAGMQVLWCPHPMLLNEYRGREKLVLAGLMGEYREETPKEVEVANEIFGGTPGEIDDGWAVLVESLENFPYKRFGIMP